MPQTEITLGADPASGEGGVTVPVYPQRVAYITSRLGKFLDGLAESAQGIEPGALIATANAQTYELLTALVPNLSKRLSEWEFRGYASADAMAAGDYDPAFDTTSPSIPEIRTAVRVASEVNGLDVLAHIKGLFGLVDPTVLRALVSEWVMNAIDSLSTTSLSSPSANGDSPSTSSGTTAPTSTASADSASPASTV